MKSSWIRMTPKSVMTGVLIRRGRSETHTEGSRGDRGRDGVKWPQTKGHLGLGEAGSILP